MQLLTQAFSVLSWQIRTVKVSNLSHDATERDMRGFFSFCGDIVYVEMKSENEQSQTAFITYKDPRGAETAILLTGAIIVGQIATIALEPDYVLPAAAASESCAATEDNKQGASPSTSQKAEDIVTRMLDKGYTLGKDAIHRAKAFDEASAPFQRYGKSSIFGPKVWIE
ncbi:UNVERIFIED_CONTAM: Binding partner of ACD11 1 [Sesamum radiatum]|uniref:Binding partner of ACD11 1 n=1 Tax=Sesamum radiatum TaxID=300843 RepID=A0AAW2NCN7_SESRA